MKKNVIKTSFTLALSSIILSSPILPATTYASDQIPADDITSNQETTETYLLPGIGAGAATGAVIAGPAGLIVGGLIGAFIGSVQEPSAESDNTATGNSTLTSNSHDTFNAFQPRSKEEILPRIQVARSGPVHTIADTTEHDELIDILTTDLSLDVYFRSGKTDIEPFYPSRLAAVAKLLKKLDQLELHLDGYADRRGNQAQNIALADQRIENVRQQLIQSGVDKNRIISRSFGEMKMVSTAGDLEAYTFDRKVVIRFERSNIGSKHDMDRALSGLKPEKISATEPVNVPVVAEAAAPF
ncbi:MAG TPA: sortase-associated OmpA-like protein PdsO [Gammaproteobacteria bacterium]|nr:sortase-associated OmpA-like protein PdsO [Gammaproteobacteria bacterium]